MKEDIKLMLAVFTFDFGRLLMGGILWAMMIILLAMGIQSLITPDPWYVVWWESTTGFIKGLFG